MKVPAPNSERGKSLLARVEASGTEPRLVQPLAAALWWLFDMLEAEGAGVAPPPDDWSRVGR